IFAESPPSGLLDISQRLLAEPDDPFAASSTHEEGAFERMAQSVGRGSEASARRDPGVTAEVAKIMGQISQMAAQNKSPSRMTTPLQSGRKRPRSPTDAAERGSERRRSRSLERVQQPVGQRQMYPPLLPQKPASAGAAAYGSEDETSRGTVGVSPQSTYNRSPTLQRQRQGGSQSVVVQRSKPIQRAGSTTARTPELQRTPAQFFSSLPRPVNGSSSVVGRRAASSGSPTPVASLSSPLKRTLSSNSNCGARPPIMPPRPILPADDESEEVPTEPEPESESESDAEPAAVVTPENRAGGRPLLLAQESMARKSVRFGPALSPEVFDVGAPPSTPLRRGTPMQMPARASSILRRTSPTRPQPAAVSPSLLRSLLTPRPTRRQAMHQYIASLSALAESPLAADKPPAVAVEESAASEVLGEDKAADGASAQDTLLAAGEESAQDTLAATDEESAQEALVDIESATVLGASP
ncbi:hypothetical protein GGI19_006754, partial [Coemansia pectinata]